MQGEAEKSALREDWEAAVFPRRLIDLFRHQTHRVGLVLTKVHKSISQGLLEAVEPGNSKLARRTGLLRVLGTLDVKLYLESYIIFVCLFRNVTIWITGM